MNKGVLSRSFQRSHGCHRAVIHLAPPTQLSQTIGALSLSSGRSQSCRSAVGRSAPPWSSRMGLGRTSMEKQDGYGDGYGDGSGGHSGVAGWVRVWVWVAPPWSSRMGDRGPWTWLRCRPFGRLAAGHLSSRCTSQSAQTHGSRYSPGCSADHRASSDSPHLTPAAHTSAPAGLPVIFCVNSIDSIQQIVRSRLLIVGDSYSSTVCLSSTMRWFLHGCHTADSSCCLQPEKGSR